MPTVWIRRVSFYIGRAQPLFWPSVGNALTWAAQSERFKMVYPLARVMDRNMTRKAA
jgi:hypothetical protein